jgi:hypothetical protein
MESFHIHLNSKYCNTFSNNKSNCEYFLPSIEIDSQCQIYISISHAVIPASFYNINSTNNILNYSLSGIDYSFTISVGNYNVNSLKTYLTANLPFIITYDSIKNYFRFSHTTYEFVFKSTSTCLNLLGFSTTSSSVSKSIISTQIINLATIQCICIATNLQTNNVNINPSQVNNFSILASIPIDVAPFGLITYKNNSTFKVNTFTNTISTLNIKLIDQSGEFIDLNGADYSMTLQFDVIDYVN